MLFQVKSKTNGDIYTVYQIKEIFNCIYFLLYKDGAWHYEKADKYIPPRGK